MILVAGSANLDFVVRAPRIPQPGETVLGHDFKTYPGGKGANQAIACARAGGVETEMLLALGDDAFAVPIEASLNSAGVRLHTHRVADQPTGTAFICVSDNAENAITVAPGANGCLSEAHLPSLHDVSHLLLQLEIPLQTVIAYARRAREQGVAVVLNAAPAQVLPTELLSVIDMLVVNETELMGIARSGPDIATRLSQINVPAIVVTLGLRGCVARIGGRFFTQPAFPVEPIDTTAAGDTFCGVLTAALSAKLSMQDALTRASAASALACTRHGAQDSIPTEAAVLALLKASAVTDQPQHLALRHYAGIRT